MGEHILKVLLDELNTVRLACTKCEGVSEVRHDSIMPNFKNHQCPFCGNPIAQSTLEALSDLQSSLMRLRSATTLRIEFPVHLDE